ncbi:MAG TPA: Xaa-Pro peptidase family protein [Burkholderiales bacterium]|nr:Xaa-Pro peptidase family protein [Burkholderiales bacterium]
MGTFIGHIEPTRPLIDWQLLQQLRWKRVRDFMAREAIDAILTNVVDNVIYLTGWPRFRTSVYEGSYGTLFMREEKEPVILCSEGDSRGLLKDQFYPDIRVMPPTQAKWPDPLKKAVADYGLSKARLGLDNRMQASLYNALVKELPDASIVNVTPVLNRARAVKNAEEIKAYEYTVSLVETGTNTAIKACKEGWGRYTENEVAALANYELLKRGCNSPDIWCCSGERAAPVRRYSTDRVVRGGELAVIDGGAGFNGFKSEFARTVWTGGRPTQDQKLVYRTVYDALEAAKAIMKPGTKTSALEHACLSVVREARLEEHYGGYPYTGHGIGLRAEAFNVTARYPEMDTVLEEGMIFNLEPGIWQEGVGGVRIEDTYLVTSSGFRVLSRAPYEECLLD